MYAKVCVRMILSRTAVTHDAHVTTRKQYLHEWSSVKTRNTNWYKLLRGLYLSSNYAKIRLRTQTHAISNALNDKCDNSNHQTNNR